MTRQRKRLLALLAEDARELRAAPVIATLSRYWDRLDKGHARVGVQLTHGKWSTFARMYAGLGDPVWREHESREVARAYARAWLVSL